MTRTCTKCREEKSVYSFPRSGTRNGREQRGSRCRPCHAYVMWLHTISKRYGLTEEGYLELLASQGGRCALCRRRPEDGERLAVDHDHETGRVRGILCRYCNISLGRWFENAEMFGRVQAYLGSDAFTAAPRSEGQS